MVALKNETDFSKIKKVYLLMGPQCNMHCRHCSQTPIKIGEVIKHEVDNTVWEFIDSYIKYALSHTDIPRTLIFWGGEPLLHWDFIKETVLKLVEQYDLLSYSDKRFTFSLVTNGLLLTEDKLEFMKKYHVKPSLSYDAPYPFAVRGKIPNSICTMLKNSGVYYSTISTFNALNCDYYLAARCMREKFPKIRHCFNFALLHTFEDMPQDIMDYDWEKICKNIKKLRIAAKLGDLDAAMMIVHMMWPLRYPQECTTWNAHHVKACSSGNNNYSITLDGSVVTCHNSDEKIGTLYDTAEMIHKNSLNAFISRRSQTCLTCEHNDLCIGNCSFSIKNEDGTFISCENYRFRFFTEWKKEMRKLIEPVTEEEKKWFEEEFKKDTLFVEAFAKGEINDCH